MAGMASIVVLDIDRVSRRASTSLRVARTLVLWWLERSRVRKGARCHSEWREALYAGGSSGDGASARRETGVGRRAKPNRDTHSDIRKEDVNTLRRNEVTSDAQQEAKRTGGD